MSCRPVLRISRHTPCGMYFNSFAPELVDPYADGNRRIDAAMCVKIINREVVHNLYLFAVRV
ncbi:MAG: hypothetical protein IJP48_02500 [Synergistaceae bacterium]|nr:hypothetical protein [Synergistaceae bacterium]